MGYRRNKARESERACFARARVKPSYPFKSSSRGSLSSKLPRIKAPAESLGAFASSRSLSAVLRRTSAPHVSLSSASPVSKSRHSHKGTQCEFRFNNANQRTVLVEEAMQHARRLARLPRVHLVQQPHSITSHHSSPWGATQNGLGKI